MTWRKITVVAFTGAASINIDNCFTSSFTHYLVTRDLSCGTANATLDVQLRAGGVTAAGSAYRRQTISGVGATVAGARSTAVTAWTAALGNTETTAHGFGQMRVSYPYDAVRTTAWSDHAKAHTGNVELYRMVYAHDTAQTYDGIAVTCAGTCTGTITIYGLKESA